MLGGEPLRLVPAKSAARGASHHASRAGGLSPDYISQCASGKETRWGGEGGNNSCAEPAGMAGSMESLVRQRRCLYKGCRAPPWKEAYRQGCLERLKKSRARLLDQYRHLGENAAAAGGTRSAILVQEVMEVEWQALQSMDVQLPSLPKKDPFLHVLEDSDELVVLEEIQKELILQEQLAIEEYEKSLQFDDECLNAMLDGLDAELRVICPVCQRNNVTVMSHVVSCTCGLCVNTQGMTEEKLRSLLEDGIMEHSQHCQLSPTFAVTNGMDRDTNLLMSCQVCDFLAVIL